MMKGTLAILEGTVAAIVFAIAELWIIASHPQTYRQTWQRAREQGRFPFLAFPKTVNEKFTWRKLFDHSPIFTRISDKLELRRWLEETGLDLKMTPVLWASFSPRSLPAEFMQGDFMIKANHDSGSAWPMWKDPPDNEALVADLEQALARDYSRMSAE